MNGSCDILSFDWPSLVILCGKERNTQSRARSAEAQVDVLLKEVEQASKIICQACRRMSSVPMGAHAAQKVHANMMKMASYKEEVKRGPKDSGSLFQSAAESAPAYSSKFMTSIWGMYNRYSVHNMKKLGDEVVTAGASKDAPSSSFDWKAGCAVNTLKH